MSAKDAARAAIGRLGASGQDLLKLLDNVSPKSLGAQIAEGVARLIDQVKGGPAGAPARLRAWRPMRRPAQQQP
jgi:hypothetical protein